MISDSPIWENLLPYIGSATDLDDGTQGSSMSLWRERERERHAGSLFSLPAMETDCTFNSTEKHAIKRVGFPWTHVASILYPHVRLFVNSPIHSSVRPPDRSPWGEPYHMAHRARAIHYITIVELYVANIELDI